jgi:outer membrane receptor protein involved in Fe transport
VEDLFVEGRLPLVEKMPLIQQLSLSASARTSKYSTGPKANAYGLGLEYAPVNEAKVRTSFQRSIRAPNIIELFSAQSLGLYNMNSDPCAGATPARSAAECARTGVTAAQYGTIVDSAAGQYNAIFGGNPSLKPETADSVTFGLVLTPTRDLSVSLDYFQIELKDVINNVNPVTTLTLCLDTGNPLYCNLIQRDARGTLWATPQAFIQAGNTNLSIYRTKGWDIAADYRMGLGGMGRVTVDFKGTRLDQFEIEELPGQGSYDCAGYYGAGTCGTPNPKWRHKLRTTWNTPLGLDASLSWRYIGKVREDVTNPQIGGTVNAVQETAGARNYFDIGLSYNFLKNYTVRFNIANLLDKDPPLSNSGAPFGNGNTYPVVYDALGRRFSLNLNATF